MKKEPFIWLQENEDYGEADCGCFMDGERVGTSGQFEIDFKGQFHWVNVAAYPKIDLYN